MGAGGWRAASFASLDAPSELRPQPNAHRLGLCLSVGHRASLLIGYLAWPTRPGSRALSGKGVRAGRGVAWLGSV